MEWNLLSFLTWFGLAFAIVFFLFRYYNKRFFAAFCSNMSKGPLFRKEKKELFARLNDEASKAKSKKLKVLEIGGGSGSNFSFVETSVDWTVTEPNLCFEPYFIDNCKEWNDRHDIGELVEAYGEDLGKFDNESFDVVIITLVLCSVSSVEETLREIRRVLTPGGTFYFLEHIRAPAHDSLMRNFHDFMTNFGIWPGLFDGCCLNRELKSDIDEAGFSKVEAVHFKSQMNPWFFLYKNPIPYAVYGWATK